MSGQTERGTGAERNPDAKLRRFALAGVVGPILFWIVVFVLGYLTPGYSPVGDYISTLGEVGAPYESVQRLNFVLLGGSILAAAVGLHRFTRAHERPLLGTVLLGMLGVGAILAGVFPQNSADPGSTTNIIHESVAIGGFVAGIAGISLLCRRLDEDDRWARHRFSTPITVVILVVPFFAVAISPASVVGLTQRIFVALLTGWVAYHSFRLYRLCTPA